MTMSGADFTPSTGAWSSVTYGAGPFNGLDTSVESYNVSSFSVDVTPIVSLD